MDGLDNVDSDGMWLEADGAVITEVREDTEAWA